MLKWATWSILAKIFHKASPIPFQPSKNTVEWFQTRWNQEKTNAQTPPKPVELLLSLHKELQGPGECGALMELRVVLSPPQTCAWQRSNATRLVLSQTSSGWCLPRLARPVLTRTGHCREQPVLSSTSHPAPWTWETPTRVEEKWHYCFHFCIGETRYECKTGLQSNFFIILSCLKSFKNNFLWVIFVRGYRGSLWKSQRPRAVYKASILTV